MPRSVFIMHFPTAMLAIVPALVTLANAAAAQFQPGSVQITTAAGRKQCTVTANGGNVSDVPNILYAFDTCGHGGDIIFPEGQNYYIASKLNPVVNDVRIEWRGIWTVLQTPLFHSSASC